MEEKSLQELMSEAYGLSLEIAYTDDNCSILRNLNEDQKTIERLFGWVDGLIQKYYWKRQIGECSPQEMIDFNIGEFEEQVKQDVELFKKLHAKYVL